MNDGAASLAIQLFGELLSIDHLTRTRLAKVLPKGMELSHFMVLNQLVRTGERSPADLARIFNLTRGAMTNTLTKLERAGQVHVRPDWSDARKKHMAISQAGRDAHDTALKAISPLIEDVVRTLGDARVSATLPLLRELRITLGSGV